ncbi:glycoside hydrolase family 13 protein [Lachnoclostridium phytofermentans]|uniref:Alpha amylase catalytic region n=1 Tax=Lachnoclostridium phytofermentans (strain ATCC 700394 / DSM 18823 / ISDg) TaxID=357809 RepID=A9KKX0_LACP7|nr:alpha-glucosidase [Lachnoclostridium phytofermentans]ABX42702.1 alpha amylase catalytic region [Lachnoclostridium phytofermentans ISDg]
MKNTNTLHPWWESAAAYQIYPRSFMDSNGDGVGDLQGIISRLPYLSELGFDLIWICPIYPSPNDDNGYDISDYQNIQKEYGTMEDFEELLHKAHERGIRVIMDLVVNHTSSSHPWFIESRSSKDNPKRDWYIWKDGKDNVEPNNWESIFGGSTWEYDEKSGQYFLHVFGKTMPDINWENTQVKKAIFDMICWWLDKGIDGFRVDAISHIKKPDFNDMPNPKNERYVSSFDKHMNQSGILDLLNELKENAFSKYDIFTVAEANGVRIEEIEEWVSSEKGIFNSLFQFDHLNLWNVGSEEGKISIKKLKNALTKWQKAAPMDGNVALVMENHDLVRSISRFGSEDKYWKESAKCLALMYYMQKGVPFIYQGQEIGMLNADYESHLDFRDDPTLFAYQDRINNGMSPAESLQVLKKSSRDNSRTPMQWDASPHAGFTTGTPWMKVNQNYHWLNAEVQKEDEDSILNFYKKLIKIKKETTGLIYGDYKLLMEESESIYAYTREYEEKNYLVVCNLSEELSELQIDLDITKGEILISNYEDRNSKEMLLKPYECRLYSL